MIWALRRWNESKQANRTLFKAEIPMKRAETTFSLAVRDSTRNNTDLEKDSHPKGWKIAVAEEEDGLLKRDQQEEINFEKECVCVIVRERKRERGREGGRERVKWIEYEAVNWQLVDARQQELENEKPIESKSFVVNTSLAVAAIIFQWVKHDAA